MIKFETLPGGIRHWHIDRASRFDKGYAEDMPPVAVVAGATALLSIPVLIIAAAAANADAAGVGAVWWVVAALSAIWIVGGVLGTYRVLVASERRWQARSIELSDLSQPSQPSGHLSAPQRSDIPTIGDDTDHPKRV